MTRYILQKYTMIQCNKAEYKCVKFGEKGYFECETLEEAKKIANDAATVDTTYQLLADLGRKRPNGDTLYEGVYKFKVGRAI